MDESQGTPTLKVDASAVRSLALKAISKLQTEQLKSFNALTEASQEKYLKLKQAQLVCRLTGIWLGGFALVAPFVFALMLPLGVSTSSVLGQIIYYGFFTGVYYAPVFSFAGVILMCCGISLRIRAANLLKNKPETGGNK